MTRDTSARVIQDRLNHREWMGWDIVRGYTYAQTVEHTAVGGVFEGFSLATAADAQAFLNALASDNGCAIGQGYCWSGENNALGALVGESYFDLKRGDNDVDADLAWYLNGSVVGVLEADTHDMGAERLYKDDQWGSIAAADSWSGMGNPGSIGWLLYRDAPHAIPEPSSLLLGALALAGLAVIGRGRSLTADGVPFRRRSDG